MTLRNHFRTFLDGIRQEGRYRTFIDLERRAAGRPHGIWRRGDASPEVVIWCSSSHLGISRHAVVNIERGAFAAGGVITTGIVSKKGTEYARNGS